MRKRSYLLFWGISLAAFCICAQYSDIGSYLAMAFLLIFRLLCFAFFVKRSEKISLYLLKRHVWRQEADASDMKDNLIWAYCCLEHACMGVVVPYFLKFPFSPPLRSDMVVWEFVLVLLFLTFVRCGIFQNLERRRNPFFGIPILSIIGIVFGINQSFLHPAETIASDQAVFLLAFTYLEIIASSFLTLRRN